MREADAVSAEAEVIKASERDYGRILGLLESSPLPNKKATGGCRSLAVRIGIKSRSANITIANPSISRQWRLHQKRLAVILGIQWRADCAPYLTTFTSATPSSMRP